MKPPLAPSLTKFSSVIVSYPQVRTCFVSIRWPAVDVLSPNMEQQEENPTERIARASRLRIFFIGVVSF